MNLYLDDLIYSFYLLEFKDYNPEKGGVISYEIDNKNNLTLIHENSSGKQFKNEYSIWEVLQTLYMK